MKIDFELSDEAVAGELGRRLADARVARAFTQGQLAKAAGVSKSTVERMEDGGSLQLVNLIRCLRALGMVENFELLAPEAQPNPMDQLRATRMRRRRVRSSSAGPADALGVAEPAAKPWTWGDGR
jgi:transcriptional regulator with XRE-family HTH domain